LPSIKELLRALRDQGWRVERTKQGHYQAFSSDEIGLVTFSDSDELRSMKNNLSQLKRAGFQWPAPPKKREAPEPRSIEAALAASLPQAGPADLGLAFPFSDAQEFAAFSSPRQRPSLPPQHLGTLSDLPDEHVGRTNGVIVMAMDARRPDTKEPAREPAREPVDRVPAGVKKLEAVITKNLEVIEKLDRQGFDRPVERRNAVYPAPSPAPKPVPDMDALFKNLKDTRVELQAIESRLADAEQDVRKAEVALVEAKQKAQGVKDEVDVMKRLVMEAKAEFDAVFDVGEVKS
jgi:hypothetical protein